MNITSFDIQSWARQASEEYLKNKDNTSLNAELTKTAQTNALNKQQIDRLVERANAATYITLLNDAKGDDRYIEFPVADSTKIAQKLDFHESPVDIMDDYRTPPTSPNLDSVKLAELFPGVEEKEEEKLSEQERYLIKQAALGRYDEVSNLKSEIAVIFDIESDKFIEAVKQASMRPETCFEQVSDVVNTFNESGVVAPLVKEAYIRLAEIHKNRKSFTSDLDVSELQKSATYLQTTIKAYKNLDDATEDLVKDAAANKAWGLMGQMSSKLFKGISHVAQKASRSRLAMGALLGGGAIAGGAALGGAYGYGKEVAQQEGSPLNEIPSGYQSWRP